MNITKTLTPKNENGSLDQRFISYVERLMEHCGQECINNLSQFHKETVESERNAGGAALHMVVKFYSLEMEEWEKKRLAKSLREALHEIGFKPSKVTKLMGAGKFKAEQWNQLHRCFEYKSDHQLREEQHDFLTKYGVTALYEMSRMNDIGLARVRYAYIDDGNILNKDMLEEIRKEYPANPDKRCSKHQSSSQGVNIYINSQAYESVNGAQSKKLISEEDKYEPPQLSAQAVVKQFLYTVEPSSMEELLNAYTPHAQDQILALLAEGATKLSDYIASKRIVNI